MYNFQESNLFELKQILDKLSLEDIKKLKKNEFLLISEKEVLPPSVSAHSYYRFRQIQVVEQKIDKVFNFFSTAENLEEITPKILNFRIVSQSTDEIQEGTEIIYKLKIHGLPFKWKTIITNWQPPYMFTDYQYSGPYKVWNHTHLFIDKGDHTVLLDEVKFVLPLGLLGKVFGSQLVKKDVLEIFKYRYEHIKNLITKNPA